MTLGLVRPGFGLGLREGRRSMMVVPPVRSGGQDPGRPVTQSFSFVLVRQEQHSAGYLGQIPELADSRVGRSVRRPLGFNSEGSRG